MRDPNATFGWEYQRPFNRADYISPGGGFVFIQQAIFRTNTGGTLGGAASLQVQASGGGFTVMRGRPFRCGLVGGSGETLYLRACYRFEIAFAGQAPGRVQTIDTAAAFAPVFTLDLNMTTNKIDVYAGVTLLFSSVQTLFPAADPNTFYRVELEHSIGPAQILTLKIDGNVDTIAGPFNTAADIAPSVAYDAIQTGMPANSGFNVWFDDIALNNAWGLVNFNLGNGVAAPLPGDTYSAAAGAKTGNVKDVYVNATNKAGTLVVENVIGGSVGALDPTLTTSSGFAGTTTSAQDNSNQSWPGDTYTIVRKPNADGTTDLLTPVPAPLNFSNVNKDQFVLIDTTTRNETATPDDYDLYGFPLLPAAAAIISGTVLARAYSQKDADGLNNTTPEVRSAGVDYEISAPGLVPNAYDYVDSPIFFDPGLGADLPWTVAGLNLAEIGPKVLV